MVFTGLQAESGSLLIEATHNAEQPAEFGVVNGFQLIVRRQEAAAIPMPPPSPANATDKGLSSGLWVSIGFGLAVIFAVVMRRAMKPDPQVATSRALVAGSSQSQQEPMTETAGDDRQASPTGESWQERAEAAERRAATAETVVRDGLMPEIKKVLKQKFVSNLVTEREELLDAQRRAAMDIAAIERRQTQMQAPVRNRLDAYEQRISDLEKELNQRGAENRELLKATIALARKKVEEERSRSRIDFN